MAIEPQFGIHMEQHETYLRLDSESDSDCESTVTDAGSGDVVFCDGVVKLDEQDEVFDEMKKRFVSLLGRDLGAEAEVVAIHKKVWEKGNRERLTAFLGRCNVGKRKNDGKANVRRAWFGGSKGGIEKVVSRGFGESEVDWDCGVFGGGVCLSPEDFVVESLQSCLPDEDGVRHVLLCRVLVGKMKVVHPGSKQLVSNFEDFDTGVDDLQHPRRYIIRSTIMNIHILPEYVISFAAPSAWEGSRFNGTKGAFKRPTSPWMAFPSLIIALSKILPHHSFKTICKDYKNYKERKISRPQFIRYIRNIAGDDLLAAVLKSCSQKNIKGEQQRTVHHRKGGKHLSRATTNDMGVPVEALDDLRKKNLATEIKQLLM